MEACTRTPPNPHLLHIENRDVVTTGGTKLTLMNPAYMMRQMTEEFEEAYGVKGKITGKLQLNPTNKPDDWQFKVLTLFESGNTEEFFEQQTINGQSYLRYMKPMYMTEGCVKCHGHLGFKDGDLRGGVSVSIPLAPYFSAAAETQKSIFVTHLVVWLLGLMAITVSTILFRRLLVDNATDPLTKIANRRTYEQFLVKEISNAKRTGKPLSQLMIDIDCFKSYNDHYGHDAGDRSLLRVAEVIAKSLPRSIDFVARFGGEEFVVLLPNTDTEGGYLVAERIRSNLKDLAITHSYSDAADTVTVSIGIASLSGGLLNETDLLKQADTALYKAKENGKNRCEMYLND